MDVGIEHPGVAQDPEHRIADPGRGREIELAADIQYSIDVENIAQDREEVLADPPDHLAIDEGAARGVA